jgi:hypothetical protein
VTGIHILRFLTAYMRHPYQDSPLGVRWADFVTAFPAAINAAAT